MQLSMIVEILEYEHSVRQFFVSMKDSEENLTNVQNRVILCRVTK